MPLISSKSITRKKKAVQRFRRVGRGIVDKLRQSINSTRLSVADRDVVKRLVEQADKNVVSRFRKGIETIKRQRQKRQLVTQFITGVKTLKKKRKEGQQREIINKVKSNECAICLEQMTPEQATTRLDCRHKYHNECLKDSFHSGHTRCAICRQPISRSIVNNLLSSASSSQQAPPVIVSQELRFDRTAWARAMETARAANPTRAAPVLVVADASRDTEARAREMAVRTAEARVARANSEYVAMMRRAVNSDALRGNALVSAQAAARNVDQELMLARRELVQAIINDRNDIRNPHRNDLLRRPTRDMFLRRPALQVQSREAIEAQASVGVERALAERAIALEDEDDDDDDDDDEDDEEALLRAQVFLARAYPRAAT